MKSSTIFLVALSAFSFQCKLFESELKDHVELYRSKTLIITQLSPNTFQHTSFKQTSDFGNVPCNGLVVRSGTKTVVFDTPVSDEVSLELINWISDSLDCRINAVIPTHFHDDCLGGLNAFHDKGIPSHANTRTIALAMENQFAVPQNAFTDSLVIKIADETVLVKYFGEGHTSDNVVGYFPSENVLFGGCLVKSLNAGKGFLGDANLSEWPKTVEMVKAAFPEVRYVVPGHGNPGDSALLGYTIRLFKTPITN